MAWELQSGMGAVIRESIRKEALNDRVCPVQWLAGLRADQLWECLPESEQTADKHVDLTIESAELGFEYLVGAIAERAEEIGTTTNGAHAVYLDVDGYNTVTLGDAQ